MIDLKAAREAMQGFGGMPGIPDSQEGIRARLDAMRRNARSTGHAARVVAALREQEPFYPSVQAIVEACQQTPDDETITAASRDCQWCGGNLWITVKQFGLSAAWRCSHQGPPPANVGPVITPALRRHYEMELAAAEVKRARRGSVFA